jgi:hypothetical protein
MKLELRYITHQNLVDHFIGLLHKGNNKITELRTKGKSKLISI